MALSPFPAPTPLSEAELDRLQDLLDKHGGGANMNLEEMDGFFAALIAGPEAVMPTEYLPEVFGAEPYQSPGFESLGVANEFYDLLLRHWNTIAHTLLQGEPYCPLLWKDEDGICHANDWAWGFIQGVDMRGEGWSVLMNDKDHDGTLLPMFMLCYEHDEDPELRPEPISKELRETLIIHMAAGLLHAYKYFRGQLPGQEKPEAAAKVQIGRNDPCPCGSGKKYKRCCGGVSVH